MSGIGALVVRLGLDAAEYISGLTKAELVAAKFAENQKRNSAAIDKQVKALQQQAAVVGKSAREVKLLELAQKGASSEQLRAANAALKTVEAHNMAAESGRKLGIAAAAAAAGVALLVTKSINSADNLNDLAKSQAVAATTLGGIGFAAEQAGGSLESASQSIGKLNKTLAAAAAGNKEAAETFALVGVRISDIAGNTRPVEDVLIDLADKFATFEDSPERAALAVKFFTKSGVDLIPLLLEGGDALRKNIEYYKQYSGVTDDLIKQSDAFNDSLAKVNLLTKSVGNALAAELLPSMQAVADAMVRFQEGGDRSKALAETLASVLRLAAGGAVVLAAAFNTIGKSVGAAAATLGELAQGNFRAAMSVATERAADLNAELKGTYELLLAINKTGVAPPVAGSDVNARSAARIKRESGDVGIRVRAPRLTDGGAASSAAAEFRKNLDLQVRAIQNFANQQKDAFEFANRYVEGTYDAGLISQRAYFDEQRRIRAAALGEAVAAIDQEIALQEKAKQKLTGADRLDAEGKIADAIARRAEVTRKFGQDEILANQRNAAAVDQLRQRYDDLRATILEMSGDKAGASKININQQVESAQRTITAAGGDQSLVEQYRKQLEGIERLKQAQESYSKLVEKSRDAEEYIALAAQESGAAELDTLRAVKAARMDSLKQLEALYTKAREIATALGTPEAVEFADRLALALRRATVEVDPLLTKIRDLSVDMGNSIAEGLTSGVIAGKNLREVLNGIASDIARVVTNKLVTQPLGNFIAKTIEGGMTGSGGGGLIGSIGSFFGKLLGFADGGRPPVGVPSWVGERGKELWVPDQPGTIVPNHALSSLGGRNYSITINPPAGMSRATSNQFAADVVRQLQMADGRNN